MRFQLDENFGGRMRSIVESFGHEARTIIDVGWSGIEDTELLRRCAEDDRCLITLDRKLASPLVHAPERFAGIVLLRVGRRSRFQDLEDSVSGFLTTLPVVLERHGLTSLRGHLLTFSGDRPRLYRPGAAPEVTD